MAYGLTYLYVHSGKHRQLLAHVGKHLSVCAVFQLKRSLYLRHVHSQGVLVKLGASGLACHGLYLRDGEQQFFRAASYVVRLLKRDAGQ